MAELTIDLEGFVSKDPEQRTAGAHTVTEVTVPWTERRKNSQTGQWEDYGDPVWLSASFWNEHGEVVGITVSKGDLVRVKGTGIKTRAYQKNDGTTGIQVEIVNPEISVLVRRPARQNNRPPAAAPAEGAGGWNVPGSFGDDTPF
ncbi:single-strand DNA-binding protein [Mycetocola sp. BIGb0189]|uniref:single-stranded DNA-binding protein n=1 Tax=Mycetocola sp. BIGb0189 TaxID=2940604 RepID=UPI00216A7B0C|nr:single-stranded DNA-binding protein [Mycetocola sp. BIGb0189]MCS4277379.1 single-strand DNA-binding protein [Mycetocola sp. BIGb0189]